MKKKPNWKVIGLIVASFCCGAGIAAFYTSGHQVCSCQFMVPADLFSAQ